MTKVQYVGTLFLNFRDFIQGNRNYHIFGVEIKPEVGKSLTWNQRALFPFKRPAECHEERDNKLTVEVTFSR